MKQEIIKVLISRNLTTGENMYLEILSYHELDKKWSKRFREERVRKIYSEQFEWLDTEEVV